MAEEPRSREAAREPTVRQVLLAVANSLENPSAALEEVVIRRGTPTKYSVRLLSEYRGRSDGYLVEVPGQSK